MMRQPVKDPVDLTILLPALNEAKNLAILLRFLKHKLPSLLISYEIIVVDGGSHDQTVETARRSQGPIKIFVPKKSGYGEALRLGFAEAAGNFIVTLDCDLSHNPTLIPLLWQSRNDAEIVIASRYIPGGSVRMPAWRVFMSKALNAVVPRLLSIPVSDMSSGFRLYRASVIKQMNLESKNFEILEEILIKAYGEGWKIREIPLKFVPRKHGQSKVKFLKFAISFMRTFYKMFILRYSIAYRKT